MRADLAGLADGSGVARQTVDRGVLRVTDGRRSTLLAVARMLSRTRQDDYTDMVGPLHRLADQILGR